MSVSWNGWQGGWTVGTAGPAGNVGEARKATACEAQQRKAQLREAQQHGNLSLGTAGSRVVSRLLARALAIVGLAMASGQEWAMASACSSLFRSVSAFRRECQGRSDTTHLPCTGKRFC